VAPAAGPEKAEPELEPDEELPLDEEPMFGQGVLPGVAVFDGVVDCGAGVCVLGVVVLGVVLGVVVVELVGAAAAPAIPAAAPPVASAPVIIVAFSILDTFIAVISLDGVSGTCPILGPDANGGTTARVGVS